MKIADANFRKFVKLSFWQRSPLISEKNQTFFLHKDVVHVLAGKSIFFLKKKKDVTINQT